MSESIQATPHLMDATHCPACGTVGNTGLTFRCGTQHIGMGLYRSTLCLLVADEQDQRVDDEIARQQMARKFWEDE